ncbi:MAG: hemerythrin domain-containing protein [Nocardioidaceae bacterium]
MAQMSMNKVIHAAFRRDLARFTTALAAFSDGDTRRADQLATAWANFYAQLDTHHHGEHETAWPAMEAVGVSRELLARLDAEHDRMAAALGAAQTAMTTLKASAKRSDADAAHAAVAELRSVAGEHMDHEEAELEPVYLAKKDDPAIKQMGREFAKVGPKVGGTFFAWLTDGAGPDELASMKAEVPAPVLMLVGGIFGRGYRRDVASVWRG